MILVTEQLAGRKSLQDIVEKVLVQVHRLYRLDSVKLMRSDLSRINEDKPYTLYEFLAGKLLSRCQGMAPGHNFRFKNSLYIGCFYHSPFRGQVFARQKVLPKRVEKYHSP